ncbi:MAG TPA: HXXEE domain-containing protein [Pyrinomonadaceae bacterium]|nr:HXXEE domain-containing protein [Pyrinomonadaceae bacterium]
MPEQEPTPRIPAVPWLWLFVITYVVHVAEEYWGGEGYSVHLMESKGVYMSPSRFLFVQAIGIALMAAGVLIAKRLRFANAFAIILAATVLGNTVTHIVSSVRTLEYEPGLVSAIVIWLPLGLFTILYFRHYVQKAKRFWISIGIGVAINVVIGVITMRGGRLV